MKSPMLADPLGPWRDALTRLETDVNALATGTLQSPDVLRALHQFSSLTLGLEQLFEKVLAGYLRKLNLPTRKEVAELSEAARRIEAKLDRLLPPEETGGTVARPARTRRPPSSVSAVAMPDLAPVSPQRRRSRHAKTRNGDQP